MSPGQKPLPLKALFAAVGVLCVLVAMGLVLKLVLPARQKQREERERRGLQYACQSNLQRAFELAHDALDKHATVTADFSALGFEPAPNNRYLYVVAATPTGLRRADPKFGLVNGDGLGVIAEVVDIGVSGTCPKCDLTIACAGNLDTDDTLDVWSISTGDRVGPTGLIPKGIPFNHVDDVTNHRLPERVGPP